jgi:hypothetical protein
LGEDEDESVESTDDATPRPGVLVLVVLKGRLQGLVEEGQVDLGQVEHFVLQPAAVLGDLHDPLGDAGAYPTRPGAPDDHRHPSWLR